MSAEKNRSNMSIKVAPNSRTGGAGPVNVVFRHRANGLSDVTLGLDYSKAAPPDLSYVADHVSVDPGRAAYTIKFGKLVSDEKSLRTRIEIVFSKSMFQNQLIQSSRNFLAEPQFAALAEEAFSDSSFGDPEKMQTFKSNNVMLGAWGDEAVADFYYLSPGDFAFAARNQLSEIRLIPAVRVTMDIQLLREFLVKCHRFDNTPSAVAE